jgi:hypothetical protein
MNRKRIAFLVVVWFGILGNWAFAAWVLFRDPERLLALLGLGTVDSTVWLFNYSVLLAILSCFYAPAAWDPLRYRVNAWLLVVARLVPASTFFAGVTLGYMPHGFLRLGIADGTIGIVELILLVRILATERSPTRDGGTSSASRWCAGADVSERRRRQAGTACCASYSFSPSAWAGRSAWRPGIISSATSRDSMPRTSSISSTAR